MPEKDDKKVHIAESGRAAAVRAGTPDEEVAAALTGADQLPEKGMELGRPPGRPEFDPHAERNAIEAGMDDSDLVSETVITTMVFVGEDEGGDFERRLRDVIAYAEGKGLTNLSATMGPLDPDIYDAITNG